jgi:type IV pilus assembly protein PilY1
MKRRERRGLRLAWVLAALALSSAIAMAQECAPDTTALHAPVTVVYDHGADAVQATIITPERDGTVRATDCATSAPLWAFTPPEVSAASAHSGLLTDVRVLRFDSNGDGIVDISAGDKVWLYFGLRRAGPVYYALDITERSTVRVLWRADALKLDGLSDAWSTPALARVHIGGATQNGEHFVLIVGGGYRADEPSGNRIFMLDAATGHVLWQADTTDPVPAGIAVLDTNADGYADRMYAVDVSGGVWRFDIWNGHPSATLTTGGLIADLQDAAAPERRFFNAPDVALIQSRGGSPYFNIAVGSGDPTAPPTASVSDRFYSLRDHAPFDARSQASYDAATPIRFTDLVDVSATRDGTQIAADSPGWTLTLSTPGERVAAGAVTVNGLVMFTTFQPSGDSTACVVTGSTRVYAVRVDTAEPGVDLDGDGRITTNDRSLPLPRVTEPAALTIRLGAPAERSSSDNDVAAPSKPAVTLTPECVVGGTTLKTCAPANALVRTFWHRRGVK